MAITINGIPVYFVPFVILPARKKRATKAARAAARASAAKYTPEEMYNRGLITESEYRKILCNMY